MCLPNKPSYESLEFYVEIEEHVIETIIILDEKMKLF